MFDIYKYISSKLVGRQSSSEASSDESRNAEPSFHLFSSLPPELRRKIWHHTLPSRILEASLDFDPIDGWRCCISQPSTNSSTRSCRQVPTLFSVSAESRGVCLEWYISFARTYIHPTLDILYISWQHNQLGVSIQPRTHFFPVQGRPLSRLHTVAMTMARNPEYDESRFGAFISCLRSLGSPQKLLLSLVGPNLPKFYSTTTGFSISSGKKVVLLDWLNNVEEHMGQSVRGHIMEALETEKLATPGFKVPIVDRRLRYITVTNSSPHILTDRLPL